MINLGNIQPIKVSKDLTQYSYVFLGEFGVGKTPSMHHFLTSISPEGKVPLFLMFEDRYQHVQGITPARIRSVSDMQSVLNQLKNPEIRKKFSGVVVDTMDGYEKMSKHFIAQNKEVEIVEDIGFGRGKHYMDGKYSMLREIANLGLTVHYIAQAYEKEDIISKVKTFKTQLSDPSKTQMFHGAYLVGILKKELNGELYVTFKKDNTHPELKNSFNLPDKVKIADLKNELEKVLGKHDPSETTDTRTIDEVVDEVSLKDLKEQGQELGGLLASNGYLDEAVNVLKTNIGTDDSGNVKHLDTLVEAQKDLAKIVVMKLEELVDKYNLK